jgi:hypothetical protein
MIEEYNIDPATWYSERELKFTPKHFTITHTELTPESKHWILNKLKGRFSVVHNQPIDESLNLFMTTFYGHPAFEDPKEAVAYELVWS